MAANQKKAKPNQKDTCENLVFGTIFKQSWDEDADAAVSFFKSCGSGFIESKSGSSISSESGSGYGSLSNPDPAFRVNPDTDAGTQIRIQSTGFLGGGGGGGGGGHGVG
jgi:hypothetical protein